MYMILTVSKNMFIEQHMYMKFYYKIVTATQETYSLLTHCGRVTQICVFNTVKLGTSASSP